MTERYLLRYFLAVVDSGNFSHAASATHVTQPTLSAGIAKLEEQMGVSLFHRNNRRVHLTEAGTRLLPYARRIESQFNQSLDAVRQIEPVRLLRIGILNTISINLISSAAEQMLKSDPSLRVEFVDGSERELTSKLAQGRVDLALTLVNRGGDRFEEKPLFEEGYVAALPVSDPLAGRPTLNAEELAASVMIVRRQCEALSETSRYFTERGVRPFFAYRSSQDERVMSMIAAGLGMTIVPESYFHKGVTQAKLNGFNVKRTIGFVLSSSTNSAFDLNLKCVNLFEEKLLSAIAIEKASN